MFSLPSDCKVHQVAQPQTTDNAAGATAAVSLKHGLRAWLVFHFTQAVADATVVTPLQCDDIAKNNPVAIPDSRIWANEDVAVSDTLVEKTAANHYDLTADAVKHKTVIFEIDPAALTKPCVYATISDSNQATNLYSAEVILDMKTKQATPPSIIVD